MIETASWFPLAGHSRQFRISTTSPRSRSDCHISRPLTSVSSNPPPSTLNFQPLHNAPSLLISDPHYGAKQTSSDNQRQCAPRPTILNFLPRNYMFEQAFRNIDDALRKEAGCTTELDYTEQSSWLLFLKYLDGLEADKADEAKLDGKRYSYILDKPYRWETWAAPKGKDRKLDHNRAITGDDLRDFVGQKLF